MQVTDQLNLLQQALCSAKHATEGLHLQPLVLQLSEAAESLRRSKAPDDGAVADDLSTRLDNAAASLSKVRLPGAPPVGAGPQARSCVDTG